MFPYTSAGPIVRYTDIETQLKQRTINISRFGIGAELLSKVLQRKFFWQIISRFYTAVSVVIHRCLYLLHGLAFWLIQCSFILTSAAILIWPSVWEKCWDLILIRTLIIPIFLPVFLNSGDAGIFLLEAGSEIIFISRLAVIGFHSETYPEYPCGMGTYRSVAWCKLEFRTVGCLLRALPFTRKICTSEISEKIPSWLCTIYTMLVVMIGWVFFSQTDFGALGHYLGTMFGIGASGFIDKTALYYLKTGFILLLISILMCRPAPYQYFKRLVRRRPVAAVIINLILFALSIAYMVYNSYTPFLYAKF